MIPPEQVGTYRIEDEVSAFVKKDLDLLVTRIPMPHSVKIIVADGHKMVREAMADYLSRQDSMRVVGSTGDGRELMELMKDVPHDVVLYSLEPPVAECKEILYQILGEFRQSKVIILTSYFTVRLLNYYMANGASSYLPKECGMDVLVRAINTVPYQKYYHDDLHAVLPQEVKKLFTDTELVILKLICTGKTNKEIADITKTAINTVAWHRKNIYEKANVNCSALLALFAVHRGIISLHEAEFSSVNAYRA